MGREGERRIDGEGIFEERGGAMGWEATAVLEIVGEGVMRGREVGCCKGELWGRGEGK